jgi:hypothetical protein
VGHKDVTYFTSLAYGKPSHILMPHPVDVVENKVISKIFGHKGEVK